MSCSESQPLPVRIAASNPNRQLQSPLFGSLCAEVRNMVFKHALVECDDLSRPYSKHGYYYRPDFKYAGKITTSLLLTCRLVYLETRLLSCTVNDHIFWQCGAPPGRLVSNHGVYFARMSSEQRALVRRVHFFAQLPWLETRTAADAWPAGLALRKLAITVRHTDWRYWEDNSGLRFRHPAKGWGAWVGNMATLDELELELESSQSEQLDARVRDAREWRFPLAGGGCLVHDGQEPVKNMWLASSRMTPGYEEPDLDEEENLNWNENRADYSDDDEASERGANIYGSEGPGEGDEEEYECGVPDSETLLDRKFPRDLVLYVRKIKFVNEASLSLSRPAIAI